MKVIVKPPAFKNIAMTCGSCKAQLEIEESDIRYNYVDDPRGDEDYFYVDCVCCGERLTVGAANVPALTAKNAKRIFEKERSLPFSER